MRRPTAAARVRPARAGGDATVDLANGRTVSGSLSNGDAANALHGYRSDDYNLQGIAAGTRVQVDMTSSFDNLRVVDSNGRLVTYNDGQAMNARLDSSIRRTTGSVTSYGGSTGSLPAR